MDNEEYRALRQEIITHFQISNNFYLSSIVTTGAVYGVAFNQDISFSSYIFLIPLIILIPTMFNLSFRSESAIRIGTYIQVFQDEKEKLGGWETRLYKLTHIIKNPYWYSKLGRTLYSSSPFFLSIISLTIFYLRLIGVSWYDYLIMLFLGTLSIISFFKMISVGERREVYLQHWRDILKDETNI
jgi:hypothetical protein